MHNTDLWAFMNYSYCLRNLFPNMKIHKNKLLMAYNSAFYQKSTLLLGFQYIFFIFILFSDIYRYEYLFVYMENASED